MPVAVAPDPQTAEEARARILAIRERQAAKARMAAERFAERDRARALVEEQRAAIAEARRKAQEEFAREQAEARAAAEQEREDATRDPRRIVARVAAAFGVTVRDIDRHTRKSPFLEARLAAIHAISEANPHFSLGRIGQCVGGRDHSTVHFSLMKMARVGVPQPDGSRLPIGTPRRPVTNAAHRPTPLASPLQARASDGRDAS